MRRGITVSLPDKTIKAIEKYAVKTHRTRSIVIEILIDEWLAEKSESTPKE